ncbi:unnamed protein product, partial [Nesidiocoris tenuis]
KSLSPVLPEDLALSFYIQSHKLVFAVYQLSSTHGTMKYECHQSEASVPWLNEVLVLFTVALQLCQQLKDKLGLALFIGSYSLCRSRLGKYDGKGGMCCDIRVLLPGYITYLSTPPKPVHLISFNLCSFLPSHPTEYISFTRHNPPIPIK